MSLSNSKRTYRTNVTNLSKIIEDFKFHFEGRGYEVKTEETATGCFISMTQGGIFKTISGMKTGLNITLTTNPGTIEASMEIGIFGKQAIPTAISMLVFWPVLIPQIVGLVQQSKLDEEAYQVIETSINQADSSAVSGGGGSSSAGSFCPFCGKAIPADSKFCPGCGKTISEDKTCPKCGATVESDSLFCNKCGYKFE